MRSRIGLALLALAGLATGVPLILSVRPGTHGADTTVASAPGVSTSVLPALGVWLLIGAVGLGIGVISICLTRHVPAAPKADIAAPAAAPDAESAVA